MSLSLESSTKAEARIFKRLRQDCDREETLETQKAPPLSACVFVPFSVLFKLADATSSVAGMKHDDTLQNECFVRGLTTD